MKKSRFGNGLFDIIDINESLEKIRKKHSSFPDSSFDECYPSNGLSWFGYESVLAFHGKKLVLRLIPEDLLN